MRKRKLIASLIAFMMLFATASPLLQEVAFVLAAETIATLNGRSYSDFEDLVDDLEDDYEGESVVIEMKKDWNAASDDMFDEQLIIPESCNAVLNMHGHMFNRNRAESNDSTGEGGLIYIDDSASLTINGYSSESEKNIAHTNVAVYNSIDGDTAADKYITTYGGTLTGGNSDDGAGGIHVNYKDNLTLNNVTIAGCKADTWVKLYGYGGGILLDNDTTKVVMNNSSIIGCFSNDDGGAIYMSNEDNNSIEMRNCVIEGNFSNDKAGGIYINGENNYVNGFCSTEIKNNCAGGDGGAFYSDNEKTNISNLTLTGNQANNGGAIYASHSDTTISNIVAKNNYARISGGGFYISKETTTISGCEVTNNSCGSSGGGIYVYKNIDDDFKVTGKCIVRDNTGHNFYISDSDPDDTRVLFSLTKGSDVHVYYYDTEDLNAIMVTPGEEGDTIKSPNCIRYLKPDNSGYHFTFNPRANYRKIFYVKNGKDDISSYGLPDPTPVEPTAISAANAINNPGQTYTSTKAGIIGTVGPGGESGSDYNLIRGFTLHQETDGDTDEAFTLFYYSDAFFDDSQDPASYNSHLATASLNMAYAGMYLRGFEEEIDGNTYYNKHAAGRQFLADIGCPDQTIYINDSNSKKPESDSIGVTIGSKELEKADGTKTGKILIPVTIRGGGYEMEWASNATLGYADETDNGEAQGFSDAATIVTGEIDKYIKKYSLEEELSQGKIVFWVTGYSRAGATANITSKRLIEKYASGSGENGTNKVFSYTCEAPKGGTDAAEKLTDKSKYYCIHNLINAVDLVPRVAPYQMGFKRYGVDHYIPGTDASSVVPYSVTTIRAANGSNVNVTNYIDNNIQYVKGSSIPAVKKVAMNNQLRAVDSGLIVDDYFHPMAIQFFYPMKIYEEGDYDGNDIEDFVTDFIRILQEGTEPTKIGHWSQAAPSRDAYAKDIQPVLRDTLALIMTMSAEDSEVFMGRASRMMDTIPSMGGKISQREIWDELIGDWHTQSESSKKDYTTKLWNVLEGTGALENLSKEDRTKFESNWPTLLDTVLRLVDADYNTEIDIDDSTVGQGWAAGADDKMMYIITFATYATYILQNHYPELNLAWARAYDSYYNNETIEYTVDNSGYSVEAPAAYGTEIVSTATGETEQAKALTKGGVTQLIGEQKIILDTEDIVGEAVYYDLIDNKTGEVLAKNAVYKGGIDLSLGNGTEKSYTISTYSMSYGVKSNNVDYTIEQINDKHKVVINDLNDTNELLYKEKDSVTVTSQHGHSENYYFEKWSVRLLDKNGDEVAADISDSLLADNAETAKFTMPVPGDKYDGTNEYPLGYSLEFNAEYGDRITTIKINNDTDKKLLAPVAGELLSPEAVLTFTAGNNTWTPTTSSGAAISYPVSWTYSYTDSTSGETIVVPASSNRPAYNKTVYTATITVPQEEATGIIFAPTESLSCDSDSSDGTLTSLTRNDTDGSVTIVYTFDSTGDGGEKPPNADIKLTVKAYELNLQTYIADEDKIYHMHPGDIITITAPNISAERFTEWDLKNSGITLVEGELATSKTIKIQIPDSLSTNELEIDAKYTPVVRKIDVTLEAPEGGKKMQTVADESTLKVTISNEYIVHPDNVSITWSPEPLVRAGENTADYLTAYTATVGIVTNTDASGEYLMVKGPNDTNYKRISATFLYSTNLKTTVNGEKAVCNKNNDEVSYTFPITKYTLVHIDNPSNISGVKHGTEEEGIRALLPKTTKILTNSGAELDAAVTWTLTKAPQADPREAAVWTAKGTATLPEVVSNPNNIPLDQLEMTVTVNEADIAMSPTASLDSGTFVDNQQTSLITNEAGGTTYYTLDGTDPVTSSTRIQYTGDVIMISREDATQDEMIMDDSGQLIPTGRKMIELNAVTEKDGLWNSMTSTYVYVFTNDIPVPKPDELTFTGKEQTAVKDTKFYTIESVSDGGKINADGDAVATDAGTYKVKLKLKSGYQWDLGTGTSTEDQEVSFTIKPMSIEEAVVEVISAPTPTKDGYTDLKVKVTLNGVELTADDYEITYTEKTSNVDGKFRITGKGNYTGETREYSFDGKEMEYFITFNLNGGTLDGETKALVIKYEKGTIIKMPLPTREGYEFDYWKGSAYKAGDEYEIVEDHTFEAIWKIPGSDSGNPGGSSSDNPANTNNTDSSTAKGSGIDTGDRSPLAIVIIAFVISLAGAISTIIIRHKHKL